MEYSMSIPCYQSALHINISSVRAKHMIVHEYTWAGEDKIHWLVEGILDRICIVQLRLLAPVPDLHPATQECSITG